MNLISIIFGALIAFSSALGTSTVLAHDLPKPVHGGAVATELDLGFELYFNEKRAWLYISDHDEAYDDSVFKAELMWDKLQRPIILMPAGMGRLSGMMPSNKKCFSGKIIATVIGQGISKPFKIVFPSENKRRC